MRIKDAVKTLQIGRKKESPVQSLCTVWSEQAEDGPDAMPLPEYPRPQLQRSEWICLNGWWEYAIRPAGRAVEKADGRILVPFSPETMRSSVNKTLQPGEMLWYRRSVDHLPLTEGKRLLLHFGAVDERCCVWWNHHKIGTHRNGYLPFSFDVTEFVKPGINELKVMVRDDTDRSSACRGKQTLQPAGMYYHAQSGIWQTVWLEIVPEDHLTALKITPLLNEKAVQLEMRFPKADSLPIRSSVRVTAEVPAGETDQPRPITGVYPKSTHMKVRLPIPDPLLWTPEHPVLYKLHIVSGEDRVDSYFAMRSFGVGIDEKNRPCLTLNGKPYFFHGVLDQGYWPESLMTPPADDAMIYDIEEMKKLGFNMLRKHIKIEPARWYCHCDRIGMVVWQDMISGGGPVPKLLDTYLPTIFPWIGTHVNDALYRLHARKDALERKRFEKELLSMIRQLYNCPCIGLWTIFNEGWGQFDSLRLTAAVKRADPTRPVDHASGWFDQGGGDVRSVHNYFRPLTVQKTSRAFVISEYGGANCNIPGHSMSDKVYGYRTVGEAEFGRSFKDLMRQILALKTEGLSGAVYTQVSDIEEETNGLLTYDRKINKTG